VALTRAKSRIFFYDSETSIRDILLERYLKALGIVEVQDGPEVSKEILGQHVYFCPKIE
jgi:hypothetical protein